ncbi:MAG: phosphoribosylanthranilate isomerase [Verrucomicrobiaceae bacterium]
MLKSFFSPRTSLKICGVTTPADAQMLVDCHVDAIGLNFWPQSKRYCSPDHAKTFAVDLAGKILRVGVFVNNALPLAKNLFQKGIIDVVQLHGDESLDDIRHFLTSNIPVIRAVSAEHLPDYELPTENFALLIDTPAGKDYGGTGQTFDWSIARDFIAKHPNTPVILAGGLNPDNAADAIAQVSPCAIDIASGAELSPGHKDPQKVQALVNLLP